MGTANSDGLVMLDLSGHERQTMELGGSGIEIQLLGKVAVLVDGHEVDAGPDRQRCVLVALAVDAGRVVSVDRLTARVWGDEPPLRARSALLSYLSRLRRTLSTAEAPAVVRRSGGYALEVDPPRVDLHRFLDLCAQARACTDDRDQADLLEQALGLWRGDGLTGLAGEWAAGERDRMQRERLAAEYDLTDALLRLGHGKGLVTGLAARTSASPLDERLARQYILALHRAGRTADALAHYQHIRSRLVEDLGCDPSPALQDLHQRILAADRNLTAPLGETLLTRTPMPRQLPLAPTSLAGRQAELNQLNAALNSTSPSTIAISAIAGVGGIGKTLLALHWAHRNIERFPDGQLFVDLRGFSPEGAPMDPAEAVRGFLDALSVDPDQIPTVPHAQAALFRSLVADKRMLVVLDNAANTAQVMPLLPGSPTCTVVITSRHHLSGLITTNAAQHIPLDVLTDTEATAVLTDRLGYERVTSERAAVGELIEFCAGLPLALGIVASHAATRPKLSLADLAAELRDLGLTALDGSEPAASLSTVLSWSLQHLTDEQRQVFALLGVAPGPDTGLPAAAGLAGLSQRDTNAVLRALTNASLVERTRSGHYRMHDLVRAYATTIADDLPTDFRESALRRVLNHYTHTAHLASLILNPNTDNPRPTPPDPDPDVRVQPFPDASTATAWFDSEHACLLAAQHIAEAHAWHETVWQLASNLTTFHFNQVRFHDQIAMWQNAARATTHMAAPAIRIRTHRILGQAYAGVDDHDRAMEHLHQTATLAEHQTDPIHQALAHKALAWALERRGDYRQALTHAYLALDHYRALDLHRVLDQPWGEAEGLAIVGWCAARVGDYDTAHRHCRAALTLHRRNSDRVGEAHVLSSLAYIHHLNSQHSQAIDHYLQALAMFRAAGVSNQIAPALNRLGQSHAALGQLEQARTVWREAVELYQHQGRNRNAQHIQEQIAALDHQNKHG